MALSAPATVIVISTQSMPPSHTASTAASALLLSGVRMIGTTASSLILARISPCFTEKLLSGFEFLRQLQIQSHFRAAVEDADGFTFAGQSTGRGTELIVDIPA